MMLSLLVPALNRVERSGSLCEGCGRPAPDPDSYAAGFWALAGRDGSRAGTACPKCRSTEDAPEPRQYG